MTRRRDEQWIEFGLRVLMNVLLNFSIGLIMAVVMFVIGKDQTWNSTVLLCSCDLMLSASHALFGKICPLRRS
jgi:hypothetical protein